MTWRLAHSLETLRSQINTAWPNRSKESDGSIGDESHSARTSDHNPNDDGVVCAIDMTNDPVNGIASEALAEILRGGKDDRLKYVISNRKIASSTQDPWNWRPYNGANPHNHHVHISVKADASHYDDTSPWVLSGVAMAPASPVVHTLRDRPTLRRGAHGAVVMDLQKLLGLPQDGDFGPATEKEVREYQVAHGLHADGVVGPYTWDLLEGIPHA